MFLRHCSDEHLVAYLDEALNPVARFWIIRHLAHCWNCRRRFRVLEEDVERLQISWRLNSPVPRDSAEDARNRFLAWTSVSGVEFRSPAGRKPRLSWLMKVPVAACLSVLMAVGGVTLWRIERPETAPGKQAATQRLPVSKAPSTIEARARPPIVDPLWMAPKNTPALTLPPPSMEQLLQIEVEVWLTLHRAGACHGEPVEVHVTPEHNVLVKGVVASRTRKQQLTSLLAQAGGHESLRVELTSADALAVPPVTITKSNSVVQSTVNTSPEPSEISKAALAALHLSHPDESLQDSRQRLVGITSRAVQLVENAMTDAWALRLLRERFTGTHIELSPQSRFIVESMIHEHLVALNTEVSELKETLSPVLTGFATGTVSNSSVSSDVDLFATTDRLRMLVESGLAGDSRQLGQPVEVANEISQKMTLLTSELSNAGEVVKKVFPAGKR